MLYVYYTLWTDFLGAWAVKIVLSIFHKNSLNTQIKISHLDFLRTIYGSRVNFGMVFMDTHSLIMCIHKDHTRNTFLPFFHKCLLQYILRNHVIHKKKNFNYRLVWPTFLEVISSIKIW